MPLEKCKTCKHWTGAVFSEYCAACCFGSKYEKHTTYEMPPLKREEEPRAIYISTARGGGKVDELVEQLMKNYQYGSKAYLDTDDVDSMYPHWSKHNDHLDSLTYGYMIHDILAMKGLVEDMRYSTRLPKITNVIFNDPATIVFWSDGDKTVVKATDETFDPEKGLAMAIAKKALGNKGNYYEEFKKWIPEDKRKGVPWVLGKKFNIPDIDEAHEFDREFQYEAAVQATAKPIGKVARIKHCADGGIDVVVATKEE